MPDDSWIRISTRMRKACPAINVASGNSIRCSTQRDMKSGTTVTQTGTTLAAREMFLNFWWYYNASNLPDSRSLAITRGIDPYDLYAGIWTENYRTLGNTPDPNGATNIAITWNYLFPENQPHNLSLALFGAETPFVKGSSPDTVMASKSPLRRL